MTTVRAMGLFMSVAAAAPEERAQTVTCASIPLLPNGGGAAVGTLESDTWQATCHALYPNASRIGLYTADGEEVAYTGLACADAAGDSCRAWAKNGECQRNSAYMHRECSFSCSVCERSSSGALPETAGEPLHAVLDYFPFVWPADVGVRTSVRLRDGETRTIHALSSSPRVFEAEAVASADEAAAIVRLAQSQLKLSVTFEGGKQVSGGARNSATAWLKLPPEHASGDERALRSVWLRLAGLVRMDPLASENMQALSYGRGDHYHYHTDTGGSPVIAGRAITALLYLSDGFEGGETSFPLAGSGETRNNVHRVREEFHNCDPTAGLAVRPKAGNAVVFYNLLPNSHEKDFATWHASCDVLSDTPNKYAGRGHCGVELRTIALASLHHAAGSATHCRSQPLVPLGQGGQPASAGRG
jgi:hypothetical protein